MYSVIPELINSWEGKHTWLKSVIKFISSPGFIAFLLIAFG
jgi:hypothetical protein